MYSQGETIAESFNANSTSFVALGEPVPGPGSAGTVERKVQTILHNTLPPKKGNEAFQPLSSHIRNGPVAQALKVMPALDAFPVIIDLVVHCSYKASVRLQCTSS